MPDSQDIATGTSQDCNSNGIPDECDLVEPTWTLRTTTGPGPGSRAGHAMGYDNARGAAVLFGGFNGTYFGDTWEWRGSVWTQISNTGPDPRTSHAMVYDSTRSVSVLFGGVELVHFGDTWEWDGSTWTQRAEAGPAPRSGHGMAFDNARGETILFGGLGGMHYGDTWVRDGNAWTQRVPLASPSPRESCALAYDSTRSVTVLFGGYNAGTHLGDTWEWNGNTWTQRFPAVSPSPRRSYALAYDSARRVTVLFGGFDGSRYGDTWEWDGSNWILIHPGDPDGIVVPSPRWNHAMAYDSARSTTVLFGGFDGTYLNDTWEYGPRSHDCNTNGIPDECDIVSGVSQDCNNNGTPDECESDCDNDGIPDECESDCNANGVPDDCDLIRTTVLAAADFESGLPAEWTATGLWHVTNACVRAGACDPSNWAYFGVDGDCNFDTGSAEAGDLTAPPIFIPPKAISATLTYCSAYGGDRGIPPDGPDAAWVEINGELKQRVSNTAPLNVWESQPRSIDLSEYIGQTITVAWRFDSQDFEGNDRLGWQVDDIAVIADIDHDCDGNAVPDECDPDCNANGTADACDITGGASADCNTNGVPDECDIATGGASLDCNVNNVPDECDATPLPILLSARSVATHRIGGGATADFHVELDISGNPATRTSESRNSGIRRLELQFDRDVAEARLTLAGPTGLCSGNGCMLELGAGAHGPASQGRIDLGAPLQNQQVYTLHVAASTGPGCEAVHDVCAAALVGDFNNDGRVDVSDKGALVGFAFQPITQMTARYDVQVDGTDSGRIDATDVGAWTGFFGNRVDGVMCP